MVTFFRHPFSRCRSHWRYEQSLCHRHELARYPYHHKYCTAHFLPKFGAVNDSAAHRAFAAEHCAEHVTRGLTPENGMADGPLHFVLSKLTFFGITERFLPSLCLFLYQAGRFDKAQCDCSGLGGVGLYGMATLHLLQTNGPAGSLRAGFPGLPD